MSGRGLYYITRGHCGAGMKLSQERYRTTAIIWECYLVANASDLKEEDTRTQSREHTQLILLTKPEKSQQDW